MANGDQTAGQVETLSEAIEGLRQAQEALKKSASGASNALSQQGSIASELEGSLTRTASGLDRLEESLGGVERGMRNASSAAGNAEDRLGGLESQVRSLTSEEERNAARKKSFTQAISRAGSALQLLGGFLGSAVSGMFSFGRAILLLPFKLLGNLVKFASEGGGGNELREAYERVRETFGDLASGPARDLIDSFRGVRAESGSLAGSGISLRRVFGAGPGGLAKAMDFIKEQAEGLGAQFQLLRGEFVESAAELIVFQKGMGLSAEQFKAFSTLAIGSGGDLTDTLGEVANLSIQLGDRFNLSAKQIAQGMATLASDFVSFGHLTQEELAATTVYAMELGVEIEALTKIAEKFSTFESAAEAASKLNQALGLQLDTMALLTADPAEQLKQIQDAFHATGRSVTDLNRAERELLATQLGLSGADLAAALSPENAGKSLEEIQAAAEGAADAPLTAEEAMNRLADSIERVFESGGGMQSFFQAFAEGFEQGLRWFGPTRELFRNIRQSLIVTRQAGRDFARMFVENFPGVTEVVEGLRDAFDPEKFREFLSKITDAFENFFNSIDPNNPTGATGKFLEDIQSAFGDTFGGDEGSGILQKLKDGFNKIATFLVSAFAGLVPHVVDGMVSLMTTLTDVLSGKEGAGPNIQSGDFISEELATALNNAFETLGNEVPRLAEPFGNLLSAIVDAIIESGVLEPALKAFGIYMFTMIFGPTVLRFVLQNIAWPFIRLLGRGLLTFLGTAVGTLLAGFLAAFNIGSEISRMMGPDGIGGELEEEFGSLEAKVGVAAASVIDTLTLGLLPDGLVDKIAEFFAGLADSVVGFFEKLGMDRFLAEIERQYDALMNIFTGFFDLVAGIFTLDGPRILDGLMSLLGGIWEAMGSMGRIIMAGIRDIVSNIFNAMIDALGLSEPLQRARDAITNVGRNMLDSLKNFFGIRSPSTVFMDIGRNLIQGLVDGVVSMASRPVEAIRELGGMALRGIRALIPGGGDGGGGVEGALGAAAQMFTAPLQMLQGQVEMVVTAVRVVAQGVEEFRALMNNLDDIDVIAELQQIGRTLGVDNGSVTVKTEPLNLTVNFQIRMDADKVAAVLANEPTVIAIENGGALARASSIG